jgi:hypothetical protein
MKTPRVNKRKLGRERADGLYLPDGTIEIDPRITGKRKLVVLIHEFLHHEHPEWTEEKVEDLSEKTGTFLWKHGYRNVELK